ncbi:MAG: hypothetical protein CM1200mP26_21280 [Acidimicrobiales bacterium]|nr:MAG: hypothetical protein CM1200mP26_21280 [Acidimicrobiales bacterium]
MGYPEPALPPERRATAVSASVMVWVAQARNPGIGGTAVPYASTRTRPEHRPEPDQKIRSVMVVDDDGSSMGMDPGLLESELLADTLR